MAVTIYPTGVSAPIDFSGAADSFMKSALQLKLEEINSRKERLSESGKAVAQFMSMEAIPELDSRLRDVYKNEIQGLRDKITERFKKTNGELTFDDRIMIENDYNRVTADMKASALELKEYADAQKVAYNKNAYTMFPPDTFVKIGENFQKVLKGEKNVERPNIILARSVIPPSESEIILMRNPLTMKQVDEHADAEIKKDEKTGRMYIVTKTQQSYDAVSDLIRADIMNMPEYKNLSPEEQQKKVDELVPQLQKTVEQVRPLTQPGRGGGSGVNLSRIPESRPHAFTLPDKRVVLDMIELNASQVAQIILPDRAKNLSTGKTESVSAKSGIRATSISFDEDEIYFQVPGGQMQKKGEPVFMPKGEITSNEKGNFDSSKSIDEYRGKKGDVIAKKSIYKPDDLPEGGVYDHSEVVEDDSGVKIVGYWKYDKKVPTGETNIFGKPKYKTEPDFMTSDIELSQPTSSDEATYYSLPLRTFGANVLGPELLKNRIGNETWQDLLNKPAKSKPTGKKGDPLGIL